MKLYLKGARLSFTQGLFEARQVQGKGDAKFSVSSIIEKGTQAFAGDANPDSAQGQKSGYKWGDPKAEFSKAIVAVATEKWAAKAMEVLAQLKAQNRLCLHDGAEKATTPGYAGNLYVNASNKIAPMVRHANGAQLKASDGVIYPGCYGDVILDIYAQDPKSNPEWGKRVNASLLGVMFNRDGERLAGGAMAAEDDFAPIAPEAQAKAETSGAGAASLF